MTGYTLLRLRAAGQISDDTWVRRADSATWRPLSQTDLREEEEAEANPSLLRLLLRHLSLRTIILLIALLVIFICLMIGLFAMAWQLLPVLIVLWLVVSLVRRL